LGALWVAMAAHNSGGGAMEQVERMAESGSPHSRQVRVPEALRSSGCRVRVSDDAGRVRTIVAERLQTLGRKIYAVVSYGNFVVPPELRDDCFGIVGTSWVITDRSGLAMA